MAILTRIRTSLEHGLPRPLFRAFLETARAVAYPARLWVAIKQGMPVWRRMDYSASPIFLRVDSLVEWDMRLRSARKEPETIQWIENYVKPGDVLFDIGANVGAYSLVAAKATEGQARVYSFEPVAANFRQLAENITRNRVGDCVTALPLALSDRNKVAPFRLAGLTPGLAEHAGLSSGLKGAVTLGMMCLRLDTVLELLELPLPNHIKLDVDGAEDQVLAGGERTLRDRSLRTVLMEVDRRRSSEVGLRRALESAGFVVREVWDHLGGQVANLLFVRP